MQIDSRIPLAGEPVNVLRAMQEGTNLATQTQGLRDHQAMQDLYRQHGAGILAGDQNALNALAGRDPMQALQVQSTRQGMRAREQEIGIARENARLRGAEFAAQMDAQQRQQALADIDRAGAMMTQAQTPEQFATVLQMPGVRESIEAIYGPGFATPGNRDLIIAGAAGLKDALAMNAWRAATPEEAAAYGAKGGQINDKTGEFKRTPVDKGMRIESDGKGGFVLTEGPGAGEVDTPRLDVSSPASMVQTIDGILSDPALDTATGMLSFTQAIPGTPQYRVGTRIRQLNGQAFLQAFNMLKGAGQITEIEGTKATEAVGRLDSAQSAADYRAALTELRDILNLAQSRPKGWASQQGAAAAKAENMPQQGAIEGGYRFLGGDPANPQSWEKVQ